MNNDPRYEPIDATLPSVLPAITYIEARRASRKLVEHFGRKSLGSWYQVRDVIVPEVRRCWISRRLTSGHFKGWGRLVHDVSHTIFSERHPKFRPHDGGHAQLELEIAQYVVRAGWLNGTLATRTRVVTLEQRAAAKLARITAKLARWQSKQRRAETAVKKLTRQLRAFERNNQRHFAVHNETNDNA